MLGFKGPRKMVVIIPALKEGSVRVTWKPTAEGDSILERFKANNLANMVVLQNKAPVYNPGNL